jgi:4'-phosphopantetheinyl transferase EntD
MIEALLPPEVAASAGFGEDAAARLLPEEAALLGRAVEKRVREFTLGRHHARMALRRLGAAEIPILRGERHEPLWPAGIVGSITHCPGYCAAAVARADDLLALGIDAETDAPLPEGVARMVLVEEERTWLATAPPGVHWDRLIFSAKESVYKAWWPLARRWLGFKEAVISFQPDLGSFSARLLVTGVRIGDAPLTNFSGKFLSGNGLVLTAVAVHNPPISRMCSSRWPSSRQPF